MTNKKRLGQRLIEKGLITEEELSAALLEQSLTGEKLGRVLVKLKMISESALNELLGIKEMSPGETIDKQLVRIIPEELIRRYKVFPVKKDKNRLYIAMADTLNVMAIDDLRLVTGLDIEPMVASEKEINALIEKNFGIPEVEKAMQELGIEQEPEEPEEEEDVVVDEAPVIRLVNSIMIKAFDEEASDIHIEPFKHGIRVRYRVDGILREVMTLPRKMLHPLVSRIKVMASMDIAERRVPQDGRVPLKLQGRELDLRISTIPTVFGEKVVTRVLYKDNIKNYTLDRLGFSEHNQERFLSFLNNSYGMILVTGPTGSGKTTTLYTALNKINSVEKNIITVEDPVEYILEGINQAQINVKAGITFATYLRTILRQDPDIIMIGEIRDAETAEIAIRAATTGHLVLSTLHTNDAPGAVNRLVDMGIEPFMVASSVIGVISQRLVRRICRHCKRTTSPGEFESAFAGLKPGDVVYHGAGCAKCNHTGFHGRVAIYEVLTVSSLLQKLILERASTEDLRNAAIREGMVALKEDGIQKALAGLTTIKEVIRAVYREDKP